MLRADSCICLMIVESIVLLGIGLLFMRTSVAANIDANDLIPKQFHGSVCLEYNKTMFTKCPVVAIILPFTTKGSKIMWGDPHPSQLLLMKYFFPSFTRTIEPSKYEYRVYLGFSIYDTYMKREQFFGELRALIRHPGFEVFWIQHNCTQLVDMYNYIAKEAYNYIHYILIIINSYEDNADYYITLDDDVIIETENWTSKMVERLYHNKIHKNFGITGFVNPSEFMGSPYAQFNFVSKIHMEIFNSFLYTTGLVNWGIDNWICYIYEPFNSFYLNYEYKMLNHIEIESPRFEPDRDFMYQLKIELISGINTIAKYLEKNDISYNMRLVTKALDNIRSWSDQENQLDL